MTATARGSRITGLGVYRPARSVGNAEVCALIDSDDEWVRRRSGIVSRRFAGPDEDVVSMAVTAGQAALADAGLPAASLDAVLVSSMSHLSQSPAAAPQVAHRLGSTAAAMDLNAACAGFCHALAVADSLVRAHTAEHVLVVGSDKMTDIIDPEDRSTAFLFGDGAGAVVVGPSADRGIGPVAWSSDGGGRHLIGHSSSWLDLRDKPDLPWPTMRMAGQEVFRWVTREAPATARAALELAGLTTGDLAAFIPHQANLRMIDKVARDLGLPEHVRVARDAETAGNTSAASIPLAMHRLLDSGAVRSGDSALLVGFGAGLTLAAQVVALP
jgi:3-oxoacyl-[acyl-carrier-protein] synthase-3